MQGKIVESLPADNEEGGTLIHFKINCNQCLKDSNGITHRITEVSNNSPVVNVCEHCGCENLISELI